MERAFKGVWIPKEIWLSKDLTLQEKVFLVEIDSLDNDKGCFASNSYFAEFFGLSNGRVSQIIKSLSEKGYIDVEIVKKDKQIIERIIKINRPPFPCGRYLENYDRGIKYSKEGYLENCKDNNINNNNIERDNNIVEQSSTLSAIKEIVDYLNLKAGTSYRHTTKDTQKHIKARLNEGFTVGDFKTVIDNQCSKWLGNNKMQGYLRPETLFGTKFESYLNSKPKGSSNNGAEGQECKYDYIGTIL